MNEAAPGMNDAIAIITSRYLSMTVPDLEKTQATQDYVELINLCRSEMEPAIVTSAVASMAVALLQLVENTGGMDAIELLQKMALVIVDGAP